MKPSELLHRRGPPLSNLLSALLLLLCTIILSNGEYPLGAAQAEPVPEALPALFHPSFQDGSNSPAASNIALALSGQARRQLLNDEERARGIAQRSRPPGFEDLELLNIVLITTIDGGLHAVERSTGRKIWSQNGVVGSDRGGRLIKSRYNESSGEAYYIVDPHDGQLYVHIKADGDRRGSGGAMQKLPLKLEELIDLSPFHFPQDPAHIFIGSKTTALIGLDLQTGQSVGTFGTNRSTPLGVCKPDGEGLHGLEDGECESDIDDRPEDLLYIGQTDYHLVMRSHTGEIIQDLLYTRMVPNAVHRDLADYWSRHGHTKGEVFIRPGRKYGGYAGSFNAANTKDQAEYEDRWRVEMLYDGTVAGFLQEQGLRWVADLGSVGVSVFDVLLPAAPGSKPILLPQPPAYLPTLFPEAQNNLQLMGLPPSALVHELPVAREGDGSIEEQGFFVMSSANHPLVGYAPRAQKGSLIGGHAVHEAVSERLPPLIDPAEADDAMAGGETRQPPEKKGVDEVELGREIQPGWVARWKRGPDWLSLGIMGLLVMVSLWIVTLARRQPASAPPSGMEMATKAETTDRGISIAFDKALPAIPKDDEDSDATRDSTISPQAEVAEHQAVGKKSNGRRRKRGKKNRGKRDDQGNEDDNEDGEITEVEPLGEEGGQGEMVVSAPESGERPEDVMKGQDIEQVDGLSVTEDVIGYGSAGTVVYKGVFQGRAVAVKRLLRDFVSIASQEVALLQASDDHQNVIRYFYQEKRDNFLFIALELCSASLADIIENPSAHQDLAVGFDRKKSIYQITSGLRHLHSLKIIHRDLKPQNVLVSVNSKGVQRMLLSDFGLAKRLDHGQSSYAQTANHAVGSIGWRAPECLRGEVQLDDLFEDSSQSSLGLLNGNTARHPSDGSLPGRQARLTKAVDLFSLGCMYFYVMTGGCHPYGDRYEREMNIVRGQITGLDKLDSYGEDGYEAKCLVTKLLSPVSSERPDTSVCMVHPMFWTAARRLAFLCDASDRFEIMELQPPEPTLYQLESKASEVIGQSWQKRLDSVFLDNLGKHRKYDSRSLRDLLRALRNKKHHYQDLPDNVKRRLGSLPAGFLHYFTSRFPTLFTHVHSVVQGSKLRHESMFTGYFEQED